VGEARETEIHREGHCLRTMSYGVCGGGEGGASHSAAGPRRDESKSGYTARVSHPSPPNYKIDVERAPGKPTQPMSFASRNNLNLSVSRGHDDETPTKIVALLTILAFAHYGECWIRITAI